MRGTPENLPDVTVAILVHDPDDWYVETIPLVRQQTYAAETIVHVLDSSADHSGEPNRELARTADIYETIRPEDFGHAKTRNHAVDKCSTELIVYLSGDAHPLDDQWLSSLLAPLMAGDADASYGRQQSPTDNAERKATYSFFYPSHRMIKTKESVAELGIRAYHFSDVTSAFRTEVLRHLRFPDELDLFEDAAISKRLLDAGHAIAYEPDACVIHGHDRSLKEMWKHYRGLGYVYSKVGILDDVSAAKRRGLAGEASTALKRLSGAQLRHPVQAIRRASLTVVKGLAFARGKRDAEKEKSR